MPRSPELKGSAEFPRQHVVRCPFLEAFVTEFCWDAIGPDDTVSTKDLWAHYSVYVQTRTTPKIASTGTYRRFSMQFAAIASTKKWTYVTCPVRGYKLHLVTRRQRAQPPAITPQQAASQFLVHPQPDLVNIRPISQTMGRGVFAARDIPHGTAVCEYLGQEVPLEEARRREDEYATQGLCPRIVFLASSAIDGYKDGSGAALKSIESNVGGMMNHSHNSPNCEMVRVKYEGRIRLVLMTKVDVPQDLQLKWSYGDQRRGLPEWYLTA